MKLQTWLLFIAFLLTQSGTVTLRAEEGVPERPVKKVCGMSCCEFLEAESCQCAPVDERIPAKLPPLEAPNRSEHAPQPSVTARSELDISSYSEGVLSTALSRQRKARLNDATSRGLPVLFCSFLI